MPSFVSALLSLLLSMSVQTQPNVSGSWAMTVVDFGVPNTMRLVLKQDGDKLTGTLSNQTLEGTVAGVDLTFKVGSREVRGKLLAGHLAGQVTQSGRALEWSAERLPQRPATGADAYIRAHKVRTVFHVACRSGSSHRSRRYREDMERRRGWRRCAKASVARPEATLRPAPSM